MCRSYLPRLFERYLPIHCQLHRNERNSGILYLFHLYLPLSLIMLEGVVPGEYLEPNDSPGDKVST
jgi:hypothetical protein